MKKLKFLVLIVAVTLLCVNLVGCKKVNTFESYDYFNCYTLIKTDKSNSKKFEEFIIEAENLLNTLQRCFDSVNGEVSLINNASVNQMVEISQDTFNILKNCQTAYTFTDKKFNPAIYQINSLWNFTPDKYKGVNGNYTLPSDEEILALLPKTDYTSLVVFENNGYFAYKTDDVKIDLGGIAKGYAIEKITKIYSEYDFGDGYINLGASSIAVFGKKTVSIKNPLPNANGTFIDIKTFGTTYISTSGNYERYYTIDGTNYGHVIDPTTGKPTTSEIISATVIGQPVLGDALSTALLAMDRKTATSFIKEKLSDKKVILVAKSYNGVEVLINFTGDYTLTNNDFNIVNI
ncbi:MAG: FAD:protein FMN transferase [Clostridia bacterium]|nr:FAD:protein FMN transferase [Clostridia bacterium]